MKRRAAAKSTSRTRRTRTMARRTTASRTTRPRSNAKPAARRAPKRKSTRTKASAEPTTDHDEIRDWVESRGGHPATVKRTRRDNQPAGILRIDYPGYSGEETLTPVTWEEWFKVFDQRKLAFLRQDQPKSRFSKLVRRKTARAKTKR